jgi:hypothetical protein
MSPVLCRNKKDLTNQQKVEKQMKLRIWVKKRLIWALSPPASLRAPRRKNLRESREMIFARFAVHND